MSFTFRYVYNITYNILKQPTPLNRTSDNNDDSNNNNNNNNKIIIDCHFVDCSLCIIKLVYGIQIQFTYFLWWNELKYRNVVLKSHRSFKTYTIQRRFWRFQTFRLCRLNRRSFWCAANAYDNWRTSDNIFKLFSFCRNLEFVPITLFCFLPTITISHPIQLQLIHANTSNLALLMFVFQPHIAHLSDRHTFPIL